MMEKICIELPDSLHKNLIEVAQKDSVSLNQFITSALSEKISAFMTQNYLETRARKGRKKKFLEALAKIPDIEPEKHDRL
jgi:metal-responsive CopG/Arc/MetJ family transcriptional regulator